MGERLLISICDAKIYTQTNTHVDNSHKNTLTQSEVDTHTHTQLLYHAFQFDSEQEDN